jgi:hypothetical protein
VNFYKPVLTGFKLVLQTSGKWFKLLHPSFIWYGMVQADINWLQLFQLVLFEKNQFFSVQTGVKWFKLLSTALPSLSWYGMVQTGMN